MGGLEIFFILSTLGLATVWGRFVLVGFQTSRFWGLLLLFCFPISAFIFVYRFERKTRKLIYHFIISLVLFLALTIYALTFRVDFFKTLATHSRDLLPTFSTPERVAEKKPQRPPAKPTPITPPVVIAVPKVDAPPAEIAVPEQPKPKPKQHGYQSVSLDALTNYVGKKVRITTATVVHEGRLLSVQNGQVEIKKLLSGGSVTMTVNKSSILQVKVYL
jgi:hypothetical protein